MPSAKQRGPAGAKKPRTKRVLVEEVEVAEMVAEAAPADDVPEVGANLRRLRVEAGLSLEKLAQVAGVSRAMLGQIELGQSTPTIKTLWKISRALEVPFSALIGDAPVHGTVVLRAARAKRLSNADGTFVSRALFPIGQPRRVEFYELTLAAQSEENADAHAPGTSENLIVAEGKVEIAVAGQAHQLASGDAIVFDASVPHVYRNSGRTAATMYLVISYNQSGQW